MINLLKNRDETFNFVPVVILLFFYHSAVFVEFVIAYFKVCAFNKSLTHIKPLVFSKFM